MPILPKAECCQRFKITSGQKFSQSNLVTGSEAPLPERTWSAPSQKGKARASAVLPDAGGVMRQRDEVKAMAASGTIARASLLWPAFTT